MSTTHKVLPAAYPFPASVLDTSSKEQVMLFIDRVELCAKTGREDCSKALMAAIGATHNARSVVADTLSALDKPENWLHS